MCGICGFTGSPNKEILVKMTHTMFHRGPDEAGYWESNLISLGMRRLAIIDVETGQQPVFNEDGSISVIFNGEIYNYPELRKELQENGHQFRSHHSDTEVIVHLYEEYGIDFLHKLNGMFAIALWDGRQQKLLLARDRAGIKPLYFTIVAGNLIFASEIKAILVHPSIARVPNFKAIHHYFSFKNIPAPYSAFAGIEQLRPGEYALFSQTQLQRQRWWQLKFQEDHSLDEQMAAKHIRYLLEDSVRLRMRCDVPFGAYLSGGIDSSSVVALMSQMSSQPVKTFSLVYEEDFKNKTADRIFAKQVSKQYGTEHYEHVMSYQQVLDHSVAILEAFDEPFSGVASTYFLTQLISQHVKVALSGDGADELFASYLAPRLAMPLHYYPTFKSHLGALSAEEQRLLQPFLDNINKLEELTQRGDETARRLALYLWDDGKKQIFYSDQMRSHVGMESTETLVSNLYRKAETTDPLNRALYVDFETLLPDQVLAFVDRLSMAHSVEVRPPFLDYRLMEFVATLPGEMKIKRGRVKHILKEAVKGLVPDAIIDRPKEGFVLPLNDWLLNHLRHYAEEVLSPIRLAKHGLFCAEVIQALIKKHYEEDANQGPQLWNLMMFQVWWERHF